MVRLRVRERFDLIRLATPDDLEDVLRMFLDFAKAHYPFFEVREEKVRRIVETLITSPDCLVLLKTTDLGTPLGIVAGRITTPEFSDDVLAQEICWWMTPEARGSRDALKLFEGFLYWSTRVKNAKILHVTSVCSDLEPLVQRYYKKLGFMKLETNHIRIL